MSTYCRDTETDGPHELEDGYGSCRHDVEMLVMCMIRVDLSISSLGVEELVDAGRRSLSAGRYVIGLSSSTKTRR
jgi:hypothetical protein